MDIPQDRSLRRLGLRCWPTCRWAQTLRTMPCVAAGGNARPVNPTFQNVWPSGVVIVSGMSSFFMVSASLRLVDRLKCKAGLSCTLYYPWRNDDWTSKSVRAVVSTRSHVFAGVARISGLCSVAGPNWFRRLKRERHMTFQSTQTEPEQVAAVKRSAGAKAPSKKAQLIKLLSRKSGADAVAICAKFGWLPHTTRAALSGLRKAGYEITSIKAGNGKPTRYRIIGSTEAGAV
jgi:hypothetical protein